MLDKLPFEILLHVLSFLCPCDIKNVRCVIRLNLYLQNNSLTDPSALDAYCPELGSIVKRNAKIQIFHNISTRLNIVYYSTFAPVEKETINMKNYDKDIKKAIIEKTKKERKEKREQIMNNVVGTYRIIYHIVYESRSSFLNSAIYVYHSDKCLNGDMKFFNSENSGDTLTNKSYSMIKGRLTETASYRRAIQTHTVPLGSSKWIGNGEV